MAGDCNSVYLYRISPTKYPLILTSAGENRYALDPVDT